MNHLPNSRLRLIMILSVVGFALVVGRAIKIQTIDARELVRRADAQQRHVYDIPVPRGTITDRNGNQLAQQVDLEDADGVPEAGGRRQRHRRVHRRHARHQGQEGPARRDHPAARAAGIRRLPGAADAPARPGRPSTTSCRPTRPACSRCPRRTASTRSATWRRSCSATPTSTCTAGPTAPGWSTRSTRGWPASRAVSWRSTRRTASRWRSCSWPSRRMAATSS